MLSLASIALEDGLESSSPIEIPKKNTSRCPPPPSLLLTPSPSSASSSSSSASSSPEPPVSPTTPKTPTTATLVYSKDFLLDLRFSPSALVKPARLPNLAIICEEVSLSVSVAAFAD